LPLGIHVTTADAADRNGALEMLSKHTTKLYGIIKIPCDGGYTGKRFADAAQALVHAEAEVAKRSELSKFAVIPKRRAVERSFGWLEHFRRLWKNCERKLHTVHQMVSLAFISLLLRRC
jgi:transposase